MHYDCHTFFKYFSFFYQHTSLVFTGCFSRNMINLSFLFVLGHGFAPYMFVKFCMTILCIVLIALGMPVLLLRYEVEISYIVYSLPVHSVLTHILTYKLHKCIICQHAIHRVKHIQIFFLFPYGRMNAFFADFMLKAQWLLTSSQQILFD